MADDPVLRILLGCTASGKTEVAFRLAETRPIEVISADSRQVYRGMDIGTAKPGPDHLRRLPHHLIDIVDPDQTYSAGRFAREAMDAREDIASRGAVPLVVGGSALYLIALTGGLDELPQRDDRLRRALREAEDRRPGILMHMLLRLDPQSASKISEADLVRQIRALEIALKSGYPASSLRTGGEAQADRFRIAGIIRPPADLRARISARTEKMLELGLLDEVVRLRQKGYRRDSILGSTIGYAELLDYLDGSLSLEEARRRIEVNTWQLARRQQNMFRRLKATWFEPKDIDTMAHLLFD